VLLVLRLEIVVADIKNKIAATANKFFILVN